MYERNAIILERYFDKMFGYNMKNNIKTNFKDYCELVMCLEKYKNISEEEDTIMQEYDSIANRIREIQRTQEALNKKNNKLQEERSNLFQNIGDNTADIQKKLDNLNNNIQMINDEIEENAERFVEVVGEFDDKSIVRTTCGKTRRNVEDEYNKKLNETLDNYQNIDIEIEKSAKSFIEAETNGIEKELKENMKKNGEQEKIPFDINVITKAIMVTIDIQKRETEIYANIYDKTNRLFTEIKNNSTKIEKHKKTIVDANSKLEFLNTIKEYLIQFLDNERLTAVNGKEEHAELMKEACKNLDEDLMQINNLYTLLLKEISKKITKKSYNELYRIEYLKDLEKKAEKFDNEIRKLNLPVTIINPNYWRIEGMKKIYDVFYKCVTENYGRDLSQYITKNEIKEDEEVEIEDIEEENDILEEKPKIEKNTKKSKEMDTRAEIDKKIDIILGLDKVDEDWDEEDEEDWEEDEENIEDEKFEEDDEEDIEQLINKKEKEKEDDDIDFDIWGNIDKENKNHIRDEAEDDEDWEEDEWDEEDEVDEDEEDDNYDDEEEIEDEDEDEDEDEIEDDGDEDEEDEEDEDYEEEKKSKRKRSRKSNKKEDNWENEFINIDKKEKKKKKSFFDKFKK